MAGYPVPVLGRRHFLDQRDRVGVGEVEEVAGAVEGVAVLLEAAGQPARFLVGLEHDHALAGALGLDRGAQPGRAGTDHDDLEIADAHLLPVSYRPPNQSLRRKRGSVSVASISKRGMRSGSSPGWASEARVVQAPSKPAAATAFTAPSSTSP